MSKGLMPYTSHVTQSHLRGQGKISLSKTYGTDHFFYDNHVCLIAIDPFSKYIEYEMVRNTSVQRPYPVSV